MGGEASLVSIIVIGGWVVVVMRTTLLEANADFSSVGGVNNNMAIDVYNPHPHINTHSYPHSSCL